MKKTETQNEIIDFTIITVTYNCENSLEKTIRSVVHQTCPSFEYVIVDGQSNDRTISIIKQYDEFIDNWISERDSGIYDAMNKGVSLARGCYVLFLNSGDVFANNGVLSEVQNMLLQNKADIAYGNIFVEQNGELVQRKASGPRNCHRMYFCHQSAFTQTEILRKMPFDIGLKMSADLNFFKCCFQNGFQFLHLPLEVVIYDLSGISNINRLAGLMENLSVVKKRDCGFDRFLFLIKLYFVINRIQAFNLYKK